jgi:DoxX-like family
MNLLTALILISSLSFMGYGIAYFISPKMKSEFKRFGLERVGALTAALEILGALGLLLGFKLHPILLISAGGLAILMLLGVAVRIKMKDSVWVSLPAFFFMILNAYIFFMSLHS